MERSVVVEADGTESRISEVVAIASFLLAFSSFFFAARIYTRVFITKSFSWDDGLLIMSYLTGTAAISLTIAQTKCGFARHITDLTDVRALIMSIKLSYIGIFLNAMSMMFMKLSIGVSLLRLRLGNVTQAIVIAVCVIATCVNMTTWSFLGQCHPMDKLWDKHLEGYCFSAQVSESLAYAQSAGNITSDIVLTFGPLIFLAKVKVSKYNAWALRGVFLVGIFATICGIVKVTELPAILKTIDPTWDTVTLGNWVMAEQTLGLFAASLPPLKSTFERLLLKLFGVRLGFSGQTASVGRKYAYGTGSMYGAARDGTLNGHQKIGEGRDGFTVHSSATGGQQFNLENMPRKKQSEEDGLSEDERRMLGNPNRTGWVINKTVDYAVSTKTIIKDDRDQPL